MCESCRRMEAALALSKRDGISTQTAMQRIIDESEGGNVAQTTGTIYREMSAPAAHNGRLTVLKEVPREKVRDVLRATASVGPALLFGPPGTGKSTDALSTALDGQPTYVQTFTAEQSKAEVIGHWIPQAGEWLWAPGPGMRAWIEGGLLVLNEVNHASEDVSNILHAWLDTEAGAAYTLPDGTTLHPTDGFRAIATMNGHPEELAPAVRDRFKVAIYVGRPSLSQLERLTPGIRDICSQVYASIKDNKLPRFSYRELLSYVEMRAAGIERGLAALLALDSDHARAYSLVESLAVNGQED